MGRTASAAVPGTTPAADAPADDLAQAVVNEGLRAETAETEVEALRREMRATMQVLAKNQVVQSAAPVELPTMADVLKNAPTVPVLTKDGWYVPAVHPTDRISKG